MIHFTRLLFNLCITLVTPPFFVSNAVAAPGLGAASPYDDAVRQIFRRQAPPAIAVTIDLKYFSTLPACNTLKSVSCYRDIYSCARLKVPLDYSKPERGNVKLALVKLPARKHEKYKGALYLQVGLGVSSTNSEARPGGIRHHRMGCARCWSNNSGIHVLP